MGNPQLAGIGLAIVALGQNLGMVIGPILFGRFVESMGWTTAGYWLIPVCILGFVAAWMVKVR
jgi:MFS family permease